jgi:hypothetical protein
MGILKIITGSFRTESTEEKGVDLATDKHRKALNPKSETRNKKEGAELATDTHRKTQKKSRNK